MNRPTFLRTPDAPDAITPAMAGYLPELVAAAARENGPPPRRIILAHLFDDTMRMLDALAPQGAWDAVVGVPYSSNRPGVAERWGARFGSALHIPCDLDALEAVLIEQLGRSLAECRREGRRLVALDCGGFIPPLLHAYFHDQLGLVQGIVEITKQGVWRARELPLAFPVLHCADSEMKRLEAQRCGETIARCLDGVARGLGLSLAGRFATVFGAGWIGSGVARALGRLDMIAGLADPDPLKVIEARLNGFAAALRPEWLERSALVVGAAGRRSITAETLRRLPDGAIVASGSSRQVEIDVAFLKGFPAERLAPGLDAYAVGGKRVVLVNDGYPANFLPGSGSVADEIVELILGQMIVLMQALSERPFAPGVHRITPEQEAMGARLWLDLRDRALPPQPDQETAA
jgi:S-adenosylhomocysteine hydrolase